MSTDKVAFTPNGWLIALAGAVLMLSAGCELRQAMYDQQKYEPLEASSFFANGQASRMPVEGTVARGQLRLDSHLYEGRVNGELATTLPASIKLDQGLLERGQERFNIYCSPCHGRTGEGNGMIVSRGLKQPPSFHLARLQEIPIGHFFDTMTNGYGVMYSYASRVPVKDRWAIAAYIRALQLSQNAAYDQLPNADRAELDKAATAQPSTPQQD